MRTDILPHNAIEVLDAMSASLREPFTLYPDFPGGGIIDVEDYDDGAVRSRCAPSSTQDPKRIIIESCRST